MINGLQKTNYGYSDNGNRYEKTTKGRKIGTKAGIGAGIAASYGIVSMSNLSRAIHLFMSDKNVSFNPDSFKKSHPNMIKEFFSPTAVFKGIKRKVELYDVLGSNNKLIGFTKVVAPLALIMLGTAGIGWLIGYGCDKIANHSAMKKADKASEVAQ